MKKKLENYRKRVKANLSRHFNLHKSKSCKCKEIYGFCLISQKLVAEIRGIENCIKITALTGNSKEVESG